MVNLPKNNMPIQKITREEVVGRARKLIKKQGYYRTSMQDLAEVCGLQKGSFYYYFKGGKEELMLEILEDTRAMFQKEVFFIAYQEELSPEVRLERMFGAQRKFVEPEEGGCLIGNLILEMTGTQPQFQKPLKDLLDDWQQALSHIFQLKYPLKEANEIALESIQEIEGAIMLTKLLGNQSRIAKVVEKIKTKWKQG